MHSGILVLHTGFSYKGEKKVLSQREKQVLHISDDIKKLKLQVN